MDEVLMDNSTSGTATREPRTLDRALTLIDPRAAAEQLRSEPAWQRDDRASVTLLHDEAIRVVLTSLHDGAELGAEVSDDWACIDVLEGEVQVDRATEQSPVGAGQRAVVAPGAPWSLRALADPTLILATFTPSRRADGH
jgi:quercetin dioxygenase-like cupin family protein